MLANMLTNHEDIAQQLHVENGLMKTLVEGLRAMLAWNVQGQDYSRKLSSLAFACKSLWRHLERLMNLEEIDGYMDVVLETKPNLSKIVDHLRQEHERFRHSTRRLVRRFEQISPSDQDAFNNACVDLADFLQKLDRHSRREAKLIQETFEQEEGGEG